MKKFLENILYQTSYKTICLLFIFYSLSGFTQQLKKELRFSPLDRTIIYGIIENFQKECSFISNVNNAKIQEIQSTYFANKESLKTNDLSCFEQHLSQIAGIQIIYKQVCEEVSSNKKSFKDVDLARIFLNIKKFESGIRPAHEKLNDCLTRSRASANIIVNFSDFEMNSRALMQNLRSLDLNPPFRNNRVEFR